jgi:hypothetical protein
MGYAFLRESNELQVHHFVQDDNAMMGTGDR